MADDIVTPQEASTVLNALGYYQSAPASSLTDAALMAAASLYQGDASIHVDGVIGPGTTAVMRAHQAQLAKMLPEFKHAFRWRLTGYYEPVADEYASMSLVPVPDPSGAILFQVPWKFYADLCLEGSGRALGELLNTSSHFVAPRGDYSQVLAFAQRNNFLPDRAGEAGLELDSNGNIKGVMSVDIVPASQSGPDGFGVIRGIPMKPRFTVAADTGEMRGSEPMYKGKGGILVRGGTATIIDLVDRTLWDGTVHDGHVVVNDCGGAILGAHYDVFCGDTHDYINMLKVLPSRGHVWWPGCENRLPYGYTYGLYK